MLHVAGTEAIFEGVNSTAIYARNSKFNTSPENCYILRRKNGLFRPFSRDNYLLVRVGVPQSPASRSEVQFTPYSASNVLPPKKDLFPLRLGPQPLSPVATHLTWTVSEPCRRSARQQDSNSIRSFRLLFPLGSCAMIPFQTRRAPVRPPLRVLQESGTE